jgi:hypothetical protein
MLLRITLFSATVAVASERFMDKFESWLVPRLDFVFAIRFEVKSSLVEPGNYKSEIGRNTMTQAEAALERMMGTPFEQQARNMVAAMGNYDNYPEPDDVAAAVAHALTDPAPKMRYMVVATPRQAEVTIRKAIDEMVQLNQSHQYSYDREALIRMLDEALARIR